MKCLILKLILVFAFCVRLNANEKYEISDLGIAQSSRAFSINNKGEVAGTIITGTTTRGPEYHVFKWSLEDGLCLLFKSNGESVRGINELGQIVGNSGDGYLWDPNSDVKKVFHVCGINNLGVICGSTYGYAGPRPAIYSLCSGLSIIDPTNELGYKRASFRGHITGINSQGTIIGDGDVQYQIKKNDPIRKKHHGFLKYSDGSLVDFGEQRPMDLNESNQVLLNSFPYQFIVSIWDNGIFKELWRGKFSTLSTSINNHGDVVGQKSSKAVLWKNGELFFLDDLIEKDSGWSTLSEANDINDQGQIVGNGCYHGIYKAYLLTPLKND